MPGSGPGLDVEDVADLRGELVHVREVGALVARDALGRNRDVLEDAAGSAAGRCPYIAYLAQIERDARHGRHRRVGDAAELLLVHHQREVLAGHRERRRARLVARRDLLLAR